MIVSIENIVGMWVFTKCGKRISVKDISGSFNGSSTLEETEKAWVVKGNSNDSDCVSGVCGTGKM